MTTSKKLSRNTPLKNVGPAHAANMETGPNAIDAGSCKKINSTEADGDEGPMLNAATTARLIERVTKIYKKHAPGLWRRSTEVGYIDAFNSMIPRYLNHRFGLYRDYDDFSRFADFTKAAILSDLQPRERLYICVAIEDLLVELDLENISHDELHDALYAPIWRVEDAFHVREALHD